MAISPILSEDFSDIIFQYTTLPSELFERLSSYSPQIVNEQFSILHAPLSENLATIEEIGYSGVPKLFTFIDTTSLESSGILTVQTQPYLSLTGKGVLIGFLDSGIDYTHPAFRNTDGTTRILRIWDQTTQTGSAPEGFFYGTEYTQDDLNRALFSGSPLETVPVTDPHGHGTAVAGIACGTPDDTNDFTGAAPECELLFVRLKEAKAYLRDYFLIEADAPAFQETDLMLGIRYLIQTARQLSRPLIICISLGTSQGSHTGTSPLEQVLTTAQLQAGVCVVTGTGNETGFSHHYRGRMDRTGESAEIELLIDETTQGFTFEFWADSPEVYSLGFTSPLGETIQPVQPRTNTSLEFTFLLEASRLRLTYTIVESQSGSMLAIVRLQDPTPGVWRIRVTNLSYINGQFHLWLPVSGFLSPSVRFYSPDADTTLVIPSCESLAVSVGTYNAYNNSLYIHSGRGFTRDERIKPEFVSPGIQLTAPAPGNSYTSLSGSCAASALTAGAAAQLAEGGLRRAIPRFFTAAEIKSLFLKGTERSDLYRYPNREWGYGTMNLYNSFLSFLRS